MAPSINTGSIPLNATKQCLLVSGVQLTDLHESPRKWWLLLWHVLSATTAKREARSEDCCFEQ